METCKDLKDHNAKSGQKGRSWKYYEKMNNIMHQKPEIEPVVTCSSSSGSILQTNGSNCQQEQVTSNKNQQDEATVTSFSKKRKAATVAAERIPKEKMERQDRFLIGHLPY